MFYLFVWCCCCFYHADVLTLGFLDVFFWRAWARCCLKKNIMFPLRCNCVFHFVALVVKKNAMKFYFVQTRKWKILNDRVPLSCRPKKKLLAGAFEIYGIACRYIMENMDSVFKCIWKYFLKTLSKSCRLNSLPQNCMVFVFDLWNNTILETVVRKHYIKFNIQLEISY